MTTPNTDAPSHHVDEVVKAGADHVRQHGVTPNMREVQTYVQDIVQRMERKRADQKPVKAPPRKPEADVDRLVHAANKRAERVGAPVMSAEEWQMRRGMETADPVIAPRSAALRKMNDRITLMKGHHEFVVPLREISATLQLKGKRWEKHRRTALTRLNHLLTQSNKHWGAWWRDRPQKLVVG